MNATANVTVLDSMTRRRDLIKWAVRNLGARTEAFDTPEYANLTADELRPKIAAMADEKGIDITVHDEEPTWKLSLSVMPLRQLGHDCFLGTLKYRDLANVTVPEDAQRDLKPARVPKIAQYVTDNDGHTDEHSNIHAGYFPSIVINIRGEDIEVGQHTINIGENATLEVMEGQHRVAGIRKAIEQGLSPDRMDDDLPCLYYVNLTLTEKRQAFADINANLVKPPKAISVSFNERNPKDELAKAVAREVFHGKVAENKTRIGPKDDEWFTLTSFVDAVAKMFDVPVTPANFEEFKAQAVTYWSAVAAEMAPIWTDKTFIASNKNVLVAIGKLYGMEVKFDELACLDWSQDGEVYQTIREKGGTNAAVPAVEKLLKDKVVTDKHEEE
jgi:DGQHR domain-containing protein